MGTPGFAAHCLQSLIDRQYRLVGVVTVPDKPAGRGQQLHQSEVKKLALQHQLPVLQPEKLRDEAFLSQLRDWQADVFVVVAFRMLPEVVWRMPRCGAFNLHASLLPQYRGAAPINWAIINGEKETGATTFFLDEQIDTGSTIYSEKLSIGENENAGSLHDRLMVSGAGLIARTLDAIAAGAVQPQAQASGTDWKPAPKIHKETCRIHWDQPARQIHNLVRGLSPYPAAFGELTDEKGQSTPVKIFDTTPEIQEHHLAPGTIVCDQKSYLKVACADGFIRINELQMAGKKRVPVKDFLLGFRHPEIYIFT